MPTDRYQQLTNSMPGRFISKRLGLPQPVKLRRYEPGQPLLDGPALVGAAPGGRLLKPVAKVLKATKSDAYVTPQSEAKAAATEAMRSLRDGSDWPFLSGRFLRPDSIVSIDVAAIVA